jgi:hypothetical protein
LVTAGRYPPRPFSFVFFTSLFQRVSVTLHAVFTQAHLEYFNNTLRARMSEKQAKCMGSALWIVKPAGLWGGQQIEMEHADDLPEWIRDKHHEVRSKHERKKDLQWVVQKYVEDPFCVERPVAAAPAATAAAAAAAAASSSGGGGGGGADGGAVTTTTTRHKVDFRLFVFVSKEGVFCARQYLGRVSPMPFTDLTGRRRAASGAAAAASSPDGEAVVYRKDDVKAHLTNTCVVGRSCGYGLPSPPCTHAHTRPRLLARAFCPH